MFSPSISPLHLGKSGQKPGQSFAVLSWNIHKQTLHDNFNTVIQNLHHQHPSDFLLLQEAKVAQHQHFSLTGYSYVTAPNIQIKHHIYGVLTATAQTFLHTRTHMTKARESWWATRKSALITSHLLHNGKILLLVNIHAINFTTSRWFQQELDRLHEVLAGHQGPMIIAGDFNTWNRARMKSLQRFCSLLDIQFVEIADTRHAKKFMNYQLDHILYRDLQLQEAYAIDTGSFSDHNPLYARFA